MEKVCHICGDVGFHDALLTCTQCKATCMHAYCMSIPVEKPINDWHCVECKSQSKPETILCDRDHVMSNKLLEKTCAGSKSEDGHANKNQFEKNQLAMSVLPCKVSAVAISGGASCLVMKRSDRTKKTASNCSLFEDTCMRTPALDILWKGQFSVADDIHQLSKERNYNFCAHPPTLVYRKIYEFSKQIPERLDFQFVPLQEIWTRVFHGRVPDERDIGLYFFPSNAERCGDYAFLIGYIGQKSVALRKQISHVELLVFTSELLPDNFQVWKGNYFLWGVFHQLKQETAVCPSDKGPKLSMQQPMQNSHINPIVKMEYNDIPIIPPGFEELHRLKFQHIFSGQNLSCIEKGRNPVLKTEHNDLMIPPGFEEVHKLKFQHIFSKQNVSCLEREGKKSNECNGPSVQQKKFKK